MSFIKSAKDLVSELLLKLADSNWDKLNDPKQRELLKQKSEQIKEEIRQKDKAKKERQFDYKGTGINQVRWDDTLKRTKDTSKMTLEERTAYEAEQEQKKLQRLHELAKVKNGKLELKLDSDDAKDILRIMNRIKEYPDNGNELVKKYQMIVGDWLTGPGKLLRTYQDGHQVISISSSKLDFLVGMNEYISRAEQRNKQKEEKTKTTIDKDRLKELLKNKKPLTENKPEELSDLSKLTMDDLELEDLPVDNKVVGK
jgi:hypothetical protein